MARLAVLAALASTTVVVAADSTTVVSLLVPVVQPGLKLTGSVVGAEADKTTYVVGCQSADKGCDFASSFTMVQGPSTVSESLVYTQTLDDPVVVFTQHISCVLNSKANTAQCSGGLTASTLSVGDEQHSFNDDIPEYLDNLSAVTVTAGVEKMSGGNSDATPGATKSAGQASATATGGGESKTTAAATGSKTGDATETGTRGSGAASTSPATSTATNKENAGPKATQNAVLAGLVGVIGGGALLF